MIYLYVFTVCYDYSKCYQTKKNKPIAMQWRKIWAHRHTMITIWNLRWIDILYWTTCNYALKLYNQIKTQSQFMFFFQLLLVRNNK